MTHGRHPPALLWPYVDALGCGDTRPLRVRRAGTRLGTDPPAPGLGQEGGFLTVEDEHGVANLVAFEHDRSRLSWKTHRRARGAGARSVSVRLAQRLAEKAVRGRRVSPSSERELDGLSSAVDRAVQLGPAPPHPDGSLVDKPRAIRHAQSWLDLLLKLERIGLDLAEHWRMVDAGRCDLAA